MSGADPTTRVLDAGWCAVLAAIPLAVWPWTERAFFTPKLVGVTVLAAISLVRALRVERSGTPRMAWLLALAWAGLPFVSGIGSGWGGREALWLEGATGLLLLALLQSPPPGRWAVGFAISGTLVAAVSVLQWLGADPFRWLGVIGDHPGARMRVYGTMGNPDFVAAILVPALGAVALAALVPARRDGPVVRADPREGPLDREAGADGQARPGPDGTEVSGARFSTRGWVKAAWIACALLILVALGAAGSFAAVLAGGAALGVWVLSWSPPSPREPPPTAGDSPAQSSPGDEGTALGWSGRRARWLTFSLAAVVFAGLFAFTAATRSLESAIAGRRYLVSVAAPHLLDAPLLGQGRGSLVTLWPQWEADALRRGRSPEDERFIALQNHAHNDPLEWALELGFLGALPRLLFLLWAIARGVRSRSRTGALSAAMLAALVARSLVDFPLARPAELCVCAVLLAVLSGEKRS